MVCSRCAGSSFRFCKQSMSIFQSARCSKGVLSGHASHAEHTHKSGSAAKVKSAERMCACSTGGAVMLRLHLDQAESKDLVAQHMELLGCEYVCS